ncbi:hypothetical protein AHF37_02013 [Paragonimus kellicotti]|nr:hypothetical protein AHF37_02013 [Paragonimus kellicotti]
MEPRCTGAQLIRQIRQRYGVTSDRLNTKEQSARAKLRWAKLREFLFETKNDALPRSRSTSWPMCGLYLHGATQLSDSINVYQICYLPPPINRIICLSTNDIRIYGGNSGKHLITTTFQIENSTSVDYNSPLITPTESESGVQLIAFTAQILMDSTMNNTLMYVTFASQANLLVGWKPNGNFLIPICHKSFKVKGPQTSTTGTLLNVLPNEATGGVLSIEYVFNSTLANGHRYSQAKSSIMFIACSWGFRYTKNELLPGPTILLFTLPFLTTGSTVSATPTADGCTACPILTQMLTNGRYPDSQISVNIGPSHSTRLLVAWKYEAWLHQLPSHELYFAKPVNSNWRFSIPKSPLSNNSRWLHEHEITAVLMFVPLNLIITANLLVGWKPNGNFLIPICHKSFKVKGPQTSTTGTLLNVLPNEATGGVLSIEYVFNSTLANGHRYSQAKSSIMFIACSWGFRYTKNELLPGPTILLFTLPFLTTGSTVSATPIADGCTACPILTQMLTNGRYPDSQISVNIGPSHSTRLLVAWKYEAWLHQLPSHELYFAKPVNSNWRFSIPKSPLSNNSRWLHEHEITAVLMFVPLNLIITGDCSGCIKVWNDTFRQLAVLNNHFCEITHLVVSPVSQSVVDTQTNKITGFVSVDQTGVMKSWQFNKWCHLYCPTEEPISMRTGDEKTGHNQPISVNEVDNVHVFETCGAQRSEDKDANRSSVNIIKLFTSQDGKCLTILGSRPTKSAIDGNITLECWKAIEVSGF